MGKQCPNCDAPWDMTSPTAEVLSAAGYLHRDVSRLCHECGATWTHGKPQGETANPDLKCPVCPGVLQYHKRAVRTGGPDTLHWKCPECFYWTDDVEELEGSGAELIAGYPSITGEIDDET